MPKVRTAKGWNTNVKYVACITKAKDSLANAMNGVPSTLAVTYWLQGTLWKQDKSGGGDRW
jgi:hypothetical protein